MSKGRWYSTREHKREAIVLARDPSIADRASLVKALMKAQNISYGVANRIVNLLPLLTEFQRFRTGSKS